MEAAALRWRRDLADWAIPEEVLAQACEPPWGHPVEMFAAPEDIPDSPSHQRARQALVSGGADARGGTVLDVGCGGGRASLALVPGPRMVTGVDVSAEMLASFAAACQGRGVAHAEVLGQWPDVARTMSNVPIADVVVCHHLLFNVPDIATCVRALHAHARRRVVIELPLHHPQSSFSPLWLHFWGVVRPTHPTADDVVTIARDLGFAPHVERWQDRSWGSRVDLPPEVRARYARVRLCLPVEREQEVILAQAALAADQGPREMLTIWWDRDPA